jgi:hypothetical protein
MNTQSSTIVQRLWKTCNVLSAARVDETGGAEDGLCGEVVI